jgi:tetratricopeptide (TPR) repeat protein
MRYNFWVAGGIIAIRVKSLSVLLALFFVVCAGTAYASEEAAYKSNQQGLIKLNARDYKGAIRYLQDAHKYSPYNKNVRYNLGVAYNNYGFYFLQKNNFTAAIEQFEKAYHYDANNAYTLYNLGQTYYRMQDMKKANEYLQKAYAIEPKIKGLKKLLEKTKSETELESTFRKIQTSHFIIAASPGLSMEDSSRIKAYLEDAYSRVGMMLDHYPQSRIVAILYSEKDYDNLLKNKPHWTLAIFDGKVRIPISGNRYTYEDIAKIIYHEYAHAAVYDMVKNNCPLWLNEGIASMAEELIQPKDKTLFKQYIDKFGFISFFKLPNGIERIKNQRTATLLYMEFHMLADFILKRKGRTGLRRMLNLLGKGHNIEYSIKKVLGFNISEFEQAWLMYIQQEYGIRI